MRTSRPKKTIAKLCACVCICSIILSHTTLHHWSYSVYPSMTQFRFQMKIESKIRRQNKIFIDCDGLNEINIFTKLKRVRNWLCLYNFEKKYRLFGSIFGTILYAAKARNECDQKETKMKRLRCDVVVDVVTVWIFQRSIDYECRVLCVFWWQNLISKIT